MQKDGSNLPNGGSTQSRGGRVARVIVLTAQIDLEHHSSGLTHTTTQRYPLIARRKCLEWSFHSGSVDLAESGVWGKPIVATTTFIAGWGNVNLSQECWQTVAVCEFSGNIYNEFSHPALARWC